MKQRNPFSGQALQVVCRRDVAYLEVGCRKLTLKLPEWSHKDALVCLTSVPTETQCLQKSHQ